MSFPSPTPLASRLLCKHFSAASISPMVCAVTAFLSFFAHLCLQPSSALCPELSPVWMTAQCNGLHEFSAFSLATLVFFECLFQPSSTLECCLLYPHLITFCGAAGVSVPSHVLFASAVQWFFSTLLSQLANVLPSGLLCCVAF